MSVFADERYIQCVAPVVQSSMIPSSGRPWVPLLVLYDLTVLLRFRFFYLRARGLVLEYSFVELSRPAVTVPQNRINLSLRHVLGTRVCSELSIQYFTRTSRSEATVMNRTTGDDNNCPNTSASMTAATPYGITECNMHHNTASRALNNVSDSSLLEQRLDDVELIVGWRFCRLLYFLNDQFPPIVRRMTMMVPFLPVFRRMIMRVPFLPIVRRMIMRFRSLLLIWPLGLQILQIPSTPTIRGLSPGIWWSVRFEEGAATDLIQPLAQYL